MQATDFFRIEPEGQTLLQLGELSLLGGLSKFLKFPELRFT